jgi:ubiquinone/menaquinone biosynthesis C-methylase UbiE
MAAELPYLIRGGHDGRERLRVLARAMRPATTALLDRVAVPVGASCLDVGCGAGDVTLELARRAGDAGRVVGVDIDEDKLAIAREEAAAAGLDVDYRRADVTRERLGAGFDLAYVRFLLTHLVDPAAACRRILSTLRPGGTVIVEDIDIAASFCHPPSSAYRRYLEIYAATAHARGGDPHIAPRLPALLRDAGFEQIRAWAAQPIGLATDGAEGAVKLVSPLTLVNIADAAIAEGVAGEPELTALTQELHRMAEDPETLMSIPRIVQATGKAGA